MTLGIGDHVVKLGSDGKPLMDSAGEAYVEYEVVDFTPTYNDMCPRTQQTDATGGYAYDRNVVLMAKLRKVR